MSKKNNRKAATELSTPELAAEVEVQKAEALEALARDNSEPASELTETPEPTPEVAYKAKEPAPDADSRAAQIIHAGRPTAVCRCGEKLVRPKHPANSTWRCLRVWNGNEGPDCQRAIPTELVLDGAQVAARVKKDRYADAKDIG